MVARIQFDLPLTSDPVFRDSPRAAPVAGPVTRIRAALRRWRQRRLLESLDDRMLRDLGISRSQALAEASKPCWRP
jgi:uncharacterized protein YjiS (DUF1127 family)